MSRRVAGSVSLWTLSTVSDTPGQSVADSGQLRDDSRKGCPEQMDMQKSKEIKWPGDYNAVTQKESKDSRRRANLHPNISFEIDGWQKYRSCNPKASLPRERLGGIDPSLYTCKDYKSWAEHVRCNWTEE